MIYEVKKFVDTEGREIEMRIPSEGTPIFAAHFRDVLYSEKYNLKANCLFILPDVTSIVQAFAVYDEYRNKRQTELTLNFIEFLEQHPDQKAKLEQEHKPVIQRYAPATAGEKLMGKDGKIKSILKG